VEGTSGAADLVDFREEAGEAALVSEPFFGAGSSGWLVRVFEAVTARSLSSIHSRSRAARVGDRRCPGRSGWGKSTAVSGRRGGG
jgi:hypothetical protein